MTSSSPEIYSRLTSYEQAMAKMHFIVPLLMLAALMLSFEWSESLNRACFLWINTSIPHAMPDALLPVWDTIMVTLTYLGDMHVVLWTILLINLSWWIAEGRKVPEELVMYLVVFAIVMILGTLALQSLKYMVNTPRPASVLPVDSLHILGQKLYNFSFPSGHTVTAFAGIITFLPIIPATWRWKALTLAAGIGVSRMGVGAHWPIDVASGAFLGIITGVVGWRIAFYIQKKRIAGKTFWNKVYAGLAITGIFLLILNVVYTPFYKTDHHLIQYVLIGICLALALIFGNIQRTRLEKAK